MIRAIARRLHRDERGLSISELLVGMMLTSVIVLIAGAMFMQTARITQNSNQTQASTRVGSAVANEVTDAIRLATVVGQSNGTTLAAVDGTSTRQQLIIYSNADTSASNPGPTRMTFSVNSSGTVTQSRCVASKPAKYWDFSSCTVTSMSIGTGVKLPGSTVNGKVVPPIFTYLNGSGTAIAIGTGALNTANVNVTSIVVEIWTQAPGSSTAPTVLKNTVVLRNLGLESE